MANYVVRVIKLADVCAGQMMAATRTPRLSWDHHHTQAVDTQRMCVHTKYVHMFSGGLCLCKEVTDVLTVLLQCLVERLQV